MYPSSDDFLNEALNIVPVIALAKCPNVDKSTLFNRLTHTRDALAADLPGLARDHKHGRAEIEGRKFICIDIDGVDGTEDGVETRMVEQSLLAIEEADVMLFMVDACVGLVPADKAIAKYLRSCQKPMFLVASKADGLGPDQAVVDFYSLGLGEIYPIAVSHDRDVLSLLERVLLPQMDDVAPQEGVDEDAEYRAQLEAKENGEEKPKDDFNPQGLPIKLAIVGRPNVGKSTLTSRILDENRVVIYDMPGTTCDSTYIPMQCDGHEYMLVDTADIRKRGKITEAIEKFSVIKTLQTIRDANVVMLVINAREGISGQDLSLLDFILNSGHSLVIVVNKWGGLTQGVKEQVKETLGFCLDFIDFARVHFISALHDSGMDNLFGSVREAYDSSTRHVSITMLTRITAMAVEGHRSPLVHDRHVKLKYIHAGGYNPPIVVIHGNQVKDLPDSYKCYLMNYFHKSLDATETPIRIQFKEGKNPFANKRSTLTPTQMRKRKHLVKHIKKSK